MLKFGEETLLVFFIERRFKYFMSSESTFASVSRFAPIVLVCVCVCLSEVYYFQEKNRLNVKITKIELILTFDITTNHTLSIG